ncbi:hypothetical protein Tco_1523881 [Tanacetum coccineum]
MAKAGFEAYWVGSDRLIPDKGVLMDYWMEISYDKDFLGPAPSYVLIRDPMRRLCHRMIAYSVSVQYSFRHAKGRKSGARLSGGHFIGRLAMHFGLLGRLHIYTRYDETWTWVAHAPERQQAATAGADEAGQAAKEAAPEIPAPTPSYAPSPPLPAPQPSTMSQGIERLEEEVHDLRRDVVGLRGDVVSFTTEQSRVSTWLISCMTQLMDASGQTYQPFDSTLVGSSGLSFRRRVRPRTGDASTFVAPHTDAQPDP